MKQLIEAVETILDKSEKLEDGTYVVPKWAARKLIRALKSYRKSCDKKDKKDKKKGEAMKKENKPIKPHINGTGTVIIDGKKTKIEWGRRKRRTDRKG